MKSLKALFGRRPATPAAAQSPAPEPPPPEPAVPEPLAPASQDAPRRPWAEPSGKGAADGLVGRYLGRYEWNPDSLLLGGAGDYNAHRWKPLWDEDPPRGAWIWITGRIEDAPDRDDPFEGRSIAQTGMAQSWTLLDLSFGEAVEMTCRVERYGGDGVAQISGVSGPLASLEWRAGDLPRPRPRGEVRLHGRLVDRGVPAVQIERVDRLDRLDHLEPQDG